MFKFTVIVPFLHNVINDADKCRLRIEEDSARNKLHNNTRSEAVARIADRTSSQHLWGSHDVMGHVTIR